MYQDTTNNLFAEIDSANFYTEVQNMSGQSSSSSSISFAEQQQPDCILVDAVEFAPNETLTATPLQMPTKSSAAKDSPKKRAPSRRKSAEAKSSKRQKKQQDKYTTTATNTDTAMSAVEYRQRQTDISTRTTILSLEKEYVKSTIQYLHVMIAKCDGDRHGKWSANSDTATLMRRMQSSLSSHEQELDKTIRESGKPDVCLVTKDCKRTPCMVSSCNHAFVCAECFAKYMTKSTKKICLKCGDTDINLTVMLD